MFKNRAPLTLICGAVSAYHLGHEGAWPLLNADGVAGVTGGNSKPADLS